MFNIIGFSFFGLGGFLGMFYLLRNKLKDDGYIFLYGLILLLSLELFYKTLIHSKLIYDFIGIYSPGRSFNLLVYPFFLFFVFSITKPNFRLSYPHILLILLALAYTIISNYKGISLSLQEKELMLDSFYADKRPGPYNYWQNWRTLITGTILPLAFVGFIAYEFVTFRKKNKKQAEQSLLNILFVLILLFYLFHQFSNLIYQYLSFLSNYSMIEWPVDIIFLSLTICCLVSISLLVNGGSRFLPPSKYASSPLNEENYSALVADIQKAIAEQKLYLQPDFGLQELSRELGSNPKYISQAINHHLGISFTGFLNKFRIEKAREELLDPANTHLTIEAIAEACGFRSKSTFFRAFKKEVGMTPKQYMQAPKK